jgi:hypothetical protein
MKTKKVWTVVWSHYNNERECAIAYGDCTERVVHFSSETKAKDFSRFVGLYSEPAEPFSQDVPSHIAARWIIK